MSEVRSTSRTGGQKGVKPERHSLIPRPGLDAIARVFGFGATKYDDHNWRKRYEWSKSYDALIRHVQASLSGEDYDDESGEPHLAHAGFHLMVLLTWLEEDGAASEYDDRYRAEEEPGGRPVDLTPLREALHAGQVVPDQSGGTPGDADQGAPTSLDPFDIGDFKEEVQRAARLYASPTIFMAGIDHHDLLRRMPVVDPSVSMEVTAEGVDPETIALATGVPVEELFATYGDEIETADFTPLDEVPGSPPEDEPEYVVTVSEPRPGPLGMMLDAMPDLRRSKRRPSI